jgi:hypothetical protein
MIGVLVRALAYASVFIGVVLVYLPAQALSRAGISRPDRLGLPQILGAVVTVSGAALAVWCILSFAFLGRGTPAPFDPPRRLVLRGPYRYVRNPMYLGAALALAGAALFYRSGALLAYTGAFLLVMHPSWSGMKSRPSAGRSARATKRTAGRSGGGCRRGDDRLRPAPRRSFLQGRRPFDQQMNWVRMAREQMAGQLPLQACEAL